jgi:uncharacterized protein (DUF3084 family)
MNKPNKKTILVVALVTVVTGGLIAASVYKYQHTYHGLTVKQAVAQRDALAKQLEVKDNQLSEASKSNTELTTLNTTLKTQKAQACARLATAKVYVAACQ